MSISDLRARLTEWLSPAVFLSSNPISLAGVVLVTTAGVLWIFLLPILLRGEADNPYLGIPAFLLLPAVFLLGLALIPAGMALRRGRIRRRGGMPETLPPLSMASAEFRRLAGFIGATTVANILIAGVWGYSAVSYMDSVSFCGTTCHVMQPEFTAYGISPHAGVGCIACHVGSGATSFVRSKIAGTRQLVALAFDNYSRPIPAPVENMRPAREICERCHWAQRSSPRKVLVRTSYEADEANTASTTVLVMKVGGPGDGGIHGGHQGVEYIALDRQRQRIARVSRTTDSGGATVYDSATSPATPEQLAAGQRRAMDCLDCHNRPAHTFELPEAAVDRAIAGGRIRASLPFIKRETVAALRQEYPDHETAARQIAERLEAFYRASYPAVAEAEAAAIQNAIGAAQSIYLENVFPKMKVSWGTYPNNLGHVDFPGCFRCHDGTMASPEGRTIPSDCNSCHELPAVGEANPEILSVLGLRPGR
jgi:hypothetical protein